MGDAAEQADFARDASLVLSTVQEVIAGTAALEERLGGHADCVYLKSADKRLLFTNSACQRVFARESVTVGQLGESLVAPGLGRQSVLSDELILSGCTDLIFQHTGHDAKGMRMRMTTAKFSLLGLGHRSMAILGVTRIYEELGEDSDPRVRVSMLSERWSWFDSLDSDDRELAIQLVRGKSISQIAEDRGVSKRTVENRRGRVLKQLQVETPLELAKLLIKLQENGFGDLNL